MQLKSKRKDGTMSNVIINESRSKEIQQYMIDKLPHPYQNKEQFEYMTSGSIGREWRGVMQHDRLTKPAVMTRAGEVIEPINKKNK